LRRGEYLFTEKEAVDSFYVVLEGRVRISLSSEGDTIAVHPPGEFTGGLAILTGKGLAPPGTGHASEAVSWRSPRDLSRG
jgi:CRP-like cAMP-binding protein